MQANTQLKRLTKAEERKWLLELARERQRKTPARITPDWISSFWLRLIS